MQNHFNLKNGTNDNNFWAATDGEGLECDFMLIFRLFFGCFSD